jgi:hypothetical protein
LVDSSSTKKEGKTGTKKNKGGRPTLKQQQEMMDDIRPMWAKGLSAYSAVMELDKLGKHYNVKAINSYYRQISDKIESSKDQQYEEQEREIKNRAISGIEQETAFLVEHKEFLQEVIKLEKVRLNLWAKENLTKKGKMTDMTGTPPHIRTHVNAVCEITNSISDLKALVYDIESQPTLSQHMEQRIAEKIKRVQEQYNR